MTELKIDLSAFSERFSENSQEILISKKVNFIFGKNGTGKSTVANRIRDQFYGTYNISIFDGFESIVGENHRLDAIALGTENTVIQTKIDAISSEIAVITAEIEKPENDKENLYTRLELANKKYQLQEKEISDFYTISARIIKNKKYDNINIAVPSYNKESFNSEITKAKQLNEHEVAKCREIIKSEEKVILDNSTFPNLDLSEYLKSTNSVLQSCVSQNMIIKELENNSDKQNFAKEGMLIHDHKIGEKCAFCGNEISEERWQQLGSFFNDETKKLETCIDESISKLNDKSSSIDTLKEIDKNDYYIQYSERIEKLNLQIKNLKSEYKIFFETMKSALEQKKKNLFLKSPELTPTFPKSFIDIKSDYKKIIEENKEFSQNLKREQQTAKDILRYYEIKNALDAFNYEGRKNKLVNLKSLREEAQILLDAKKEELEQKKSLKNELILQTKDEEKIAKQINKRLSHIGVSSFSLELVQSDKENQKGQYQIKGHNGIIRSITELSKGEKNIIAFLYFILALEKADNDTRPKIVVLDDPMTSNDDTMQYLMISEIQKFYRELSDGNYLLILTHNCHFYLNVRPNTAQSYKENGQEISHYGKFGNYHMISDGKHTTINKIEKGKQDFITNYEMLWRELTFLFDSNEPNLMLNVCRKICETYMHFTKKGVESFYGDNISAKKLFDVNQHSIDDLEAEQNGKTKEEIKKILTGLFEMNNAKEHFESHFKRG